MPDWAKNKDYILKYGSEFWNTRITSAWRNCFMVLKARLTGLTVRCRSAWLVSTWTPHAMPALPVPEDTTRYTNKIKTIWKCLKLKNVLIIRRKQKKMGGNLIFWPLIATGAKSSIQMRICKSVVGILNSWSGFGSVPKCCVLGHWFMLCRFGALYRDFPDRSFSWGKKRKRSVLC